MEHRIELETAQAWLLRRLTSIAALTGEEEHAILALPVTLRSLPADQDIVREGDRPAECCLIVSGFACRYKVLAEGKRQIIAFHIPGDLPDLQSLHLHVLDHNMATLAPARLAFIPHAALHQAIRAHPGIGAALWRESLIDAGIFREWIVGLGRRTALERMARLFCEMAWRMRAVGLCDRHSYEMPVTQVELGDAMGLSTVHVNRVLQDLRREGLMTFRASRVTIEDPEGLARLAEFDPTYLHIHRPAPA